MIHQEKPDWFVRSKTAADAAWIPSVMRQEWGSEIVAVHGQVFQPVDLAGFIAEEKGRIAGLLTYHMEGKACEIVTLNSWHRCIGVGTALIEAVEQEARKRSCRRLWLITTNDNLAALGFYQKRGFSLRALHPGSVARLRTLKPEIPGTGCEGIPIRDEIELEMDLQEIDAKDAGQLPA